METIPLNTDPPRHPHLRKIATHMLNSNVRDLLILVDLKFIILRHQIDPLQAMANHLHRMDEAHHNRHRDNSNNKRAAVSFQN